MCVVLSDLSVYGRVVQSNNVIFPDSLGVEHTDPSSYFEFESMPVRTVRQNTRRKTAKRPQTTTADQVDVFADTDPQSPGGSNNNNNQQFGGKQNQNNSGVRPTNQNQKQQSTTTVTTTTSEQLRDSCNTHCRGVTTSEYNPVCGTDNESYTNNNFLKCVAQCGVCKYIISLCVYYIIIHKKKGFIVTLFEKCTFMWTYNCPTRKCT